MRSCQIYNSRNYSRSLNKDDIMPVQDIYNSRNYSRSLNISDNGGNPISTTVEIIQGL